MGVEEWRERVGTWGGGSPPRGSRSGGSGTLTQKWGWLFFSLLLNVGCSIRKLLHFSRALYGMPLLDMLASLPVISALMTYKLMASWPLALRKLQKSTQGPENKNATKTPDLRPKTRDQKCQTTVQPEMVSRRVEAPSHSRRTGNKI